MRFCRNETTYKTKTNVMESSKIHAAITNEIIFWLVVSFVTLTIKSLLKGIQEIHLDHMLSFPLYELRPGFPSL